MRQDESIRAGHLDLCCLCVSAVEWNNVYSRTESSSGTHLAWDKNNVKFQTLVGHPIGSPAAFEVTCVRRMSEVIRRLCQHSGTPFLDITNVRPPRED